MLKYEYLNNVSADKAVDDYLSALKQAGFCAEIETISVSEALGRVSAEAVYAAVSSPHYNASAMDGVAIKAADTFGACEAAPLTLSSEMYVMVDTGDPMPEWCDAVIMVEDLIYEADRIRIIAPATPWQNVRQIGEDICASDMLLPSFTLITPYVLGALLAAGVLNIKVVKKPVVGIIPTGDEVVSVSSKPKPGDVMEFNSAIFSSMLTQWGCESKVYPIVKDKKQLLSAQLKKALKECDMVLINAGSSAGRDDYTSSVIAENGKVIYHGIAIKPGKPTVLGICGSKAVLGVPGYPVSGIIVLIKLFKPLIESLLKIKIDRPQVDEAYLSKRINKSLKYEEYIRVQLSEASGKLTATPLNRAAGVVSSFVKADGLICLPQNSEGSEAGEKLNVQLLRTREDIASTIAVIGSHDPLIDEISDILRLNASPYFIASSHVGSTGGIMAVKRGEAHTGGIHLLDEETGAYNVSYLKKYFPGNEAVLVHCVKRQQGLMIAHNKPKNIKDIADIAGEGISYVNRQKGSGTRILLDYLLKKQGVSPKDIYGYEREEFTHTSVAAQIASGSADCGMGIYSAAKIYSLDFIPICSEQYDFIVLEKNLDSKMLKAFIEVLKSSEFSKRVLGMGGYEMNSPGEIEFISE